MIRALLLVLLVLSSIFAVPAAYSSHQACDPGYIETLDPETGFTKCVFEERVVEEIDTMDDIERLKSYLNRSINSSVF